MVCHAGASCRRDGRRGEPKPKAPVDWVFELQAPNTIHPSGFRKNLLEPGDEVTVDLQPTKNGNSNGRLTRLVLADGTELDPQSFRRGASGRGGETR